ncbi:hypothetical protein GCM10011531_17620 [Aquaticitalea lipolytica]|uniref:Uncharacterized protein n=1 Tax=Aquaticitalea lipolytica TaxID=1247562 RepID=A0A8J2TQ10_9FLAO|nr:hypothetical protein [Aquaticitalea lipolytica]GFZ87006.1 hypothetical protein GCM10011531_17620 [Aquaticitalea lipolytica]
MENELKSCKNCGDSIIDGRSDKIFCNDYCRYYYNNENGLRNRVYQFFLKYKESIVKYIDDEIKSITANLDTATKKMNEAEHESEDYWDGLFKKIILSQDLKQLKKLKESIPF